MIKTPKYQVSFRLFYACRQREWIGTPVGYGLKLSQTQNKWRNTKLGRRAEYTKYCFPISYDFLKALTCHKIRTANVKISQITYFNKHTLLCTLLKATKPHRCECIKQTYNFILLLQKSTHYEHVLKLFRESAVKEIPR